jgi:hypothetical protein
MVRIAGVLLFRAGGADPTLTKSNKGAVAEAGGVYLGLQPRLPSLPLRVIHLVPGPTLRAHSRYKMFLTFCEPPYGGHSLLAPQTKKATQFSGDFEALESAH